MSKLQEYLNKINTGYNEMIVDMERLGTVDVLLDYEYKGIQVSGQTPKELIVAINKQLDEPLSPKDERKVREDIVRQINGWLRPLAQARNMVGLGNGNKAFPLY